MGRQPLIEGTVSMNQIEGHVTHVESAGGIALVEVQAGSMSLSASVLGHGSNVWPCGARVLASFKETEVALAKGLTGQISLRNRLSGTIRAIQYGAILTAVELDADGFRFKAIVTTRSARTMALAVGDAVEGLIKANEISLESLP